MDKIDIILWVLSGGFGLMLVMWHTLNSRIDSVSLEIKDVRSEIKDVRSEIKDVRNEIKDVRVEIKDLRDEVKDIDRRLCRIEGSMTSKECCVLSNERQHKKAE